MATGSQWDQHNLTDLIRDILRTIPQDTTYGTGRAFLTTYQIAIEFAQRNPQIVAALGYSVGGEGEGPYALTNYIARWLPDRMQRGATDIEMGLLDPQHMVSLAFDDNDVTRTATTNQAGFNTTMFRLR
jgi:hypothetical protein